MTASDRPPRQFRSLVRLLTLIWCLCVWLPAQAQQARPSMLQGLEWYYQTYQPEDYEQSLLAQAWWDGLDWEAVQNLFALRITDETHYFLEWRGYLIPSEYAADSHSFTILRVAGYLKGAATLLAVNREWCTPQGCQSRTVFGWLEGQKFRSVPLETLVPALMDKEFYTRAAPPCLQGQALEIAFLPSRLDASLSAVASFTLEARQRCEQAGEPMVNLTRSVRLTWHAPSATFRKGG